jgi:hypothetical protein
LIIAGFGRDHPCGELIGDSDRAFAAERTDVENINLDMAFTTTRAKMTRIRRRRDLPPRSFAASLSKSTEHEHDKQDDKENRYATPKHFYFLPFADRFTVDLRLGFLTHLPLFFTKPLLHATVFVVTFSDADGDGKFPTPLNVTLDGVAKTGGAPGTP